MAHSSPPLTNASTTQLNTLTVNIQREWLARIIDGSKKIEYRGFTPYWETRVLKVGPPPFYLRLINGMRADSPEATVLVHFIDIDLMAQNFRLHIQEVLETIRWKPAWHKNYPPLAVSVEPSVDEIVSGTVVSSDLCWELADKDFSQLRDRKKVSLYLPSDSSDPAVLDQLLSMPEEPFRVRLTAGSRSRSAIVVNAYQRYWEDTLDCELIALSSHD